MKTFSVMVKRNVKMFFSDKGLFFSSMITPIILLVLYATFLGNVFKDSFVSSLEENFSDITPFKGVISGIVGGQLLSSLLAVSCVTVSFCSNLIMVQDKYTGVRKDLLVSPVKKSTLALAYYAGTLIVTLIVTLSATLVGCLYIALDGGWYMSFGDVVLLVTDVILLTVFGTALSSIVNMFLSTQGQASAVGTIVSSGYGFLCGAYMPIKSFPLGLQRFLSFLPGTYGTSLIKEHCLDGAFRECAKKGIPDEAIANMKKAIDCSFDFFGSDVTTFAKYAVVIGSIVLFIGIYVLLNALGKKRK